MATDIDIDGVAVSSGLPGAGREELAAYVAHERANLPATAALTRLDVRPGPQPGTAELHAYYADAARPAPKFQRIRRITGYLVGDVDRWNNAKRAELSDRVKHGVDTKE